MDKETFKYDVYQQLIKNSSDFMINAVETLKENDNRGFDFRYFSTWEGHKLKSAFLSITTALELLLKSIIWFHDWKLIFAKPKDADFEKIKSGKFVSLKFEECGLVIKKQCGFIIQQRYSDQIEIIRIARNKLVHYQNDEIEDNYIELLSNGIDVYLEIYRDFVESINVPNSQIDIDYSLVDIEKYVHVRLQSIQYRLISANRPKSIHFSSCPRCSLDTIIFKNEDYIQCLFCNYTNHIEEEALIGNQDGLRCPVCNKETMIYISDIENDKETILNFFFFSISKSVLC